MIKMGCRRRAPSFQGMQKLGLLRGFGWIRLGSLLAIFRIVLLILQHVLALLAANKQGEGTLFARTTGRPAR